MGVQRLHLSACVSQGFIDILVKGATHQDLVKAIPTTHGGESWAERKVLSHVVERLLHGMEGVNPPCRRPGSL